MQNLKAYTTLFLVAVYFLLHYLQANAFGPEFIRYHGKDLILIPLLMLGINSACIILRIPIEIGIKELIITLLVCILAFEIIFPELGMAFALDVIDVLFYFIGAIFYFIVFLSKINVKYLQYVGT